MGWQKTTHATVPFSIMDNFLYANRRVELALWDTAGQEDFDKVSF